MMFVLLFFFLRFFYFFSCGSSSSNRSSKGLYNQMKYIGCVALFLLFSDVFLVVFETRTKEKESE